MALRAFRVQALGFRALGSSLGLLGGSDRWRRGCHSDCYEGFTGFMRLGFDFGLQDDWY